MRSNDPIRWETYTLLRYVIEWSGTNCRARPMYMMIPSTTVAMLSIWSCLQVEDLPSLHSSGMVDALTAMQTSPISMTMDAAISRTSRLVKWFKLACSTYRSYSLSSCNNIIVSNDWMGNFVSIWTLKTYSIQRNNILWDGKFKMITRLHATKLYS